jgi:hypothetical protein
VSSKESERECISIGIKYCRFTDGVISASGR